MARRLPWIVLALLAGSALHAGSLDLNLNDDAARLTYAWKPIAERWGVDAGWLHHQDDGDVAALGFQVVGEVSSGSPPVFAGLGGKLFWVDTDFGDGAALGLGGFVRYRPPNLQRLNLGARLYFAPDVVSFGDAVEFWEAGASIGYDIFEGANVYLGYRRIEAEFDGSIDVEIDSDLHLGIRLEF